jgi:hypothetical protein
MSSPRFSLDLAAVVFGDDVDRSRAPYEAAIVERFRSWLDASDRGQAHAAADEIDRRLISALSGPNMLEVARLIEARFPELIESMPMLKGHLEHLDRAHQLAQVFMPGNLTMLVSALREEGTR